MEVAKTMLANMFKGDYIEDSIENVVCRMTDDSKKQKCSHETLERKIQAGYEEHHEVCRT